MRRLAVIVVAVSGGGQLAGSAENAACPGSRDFQLGGSWFGSSKVGALQSASILMTRFPDDSTILNVHP